MSLVKVKTKSQVTIPDAIRRKLGVQVGDLFEASVEKGTIVLRPKAVIDRSPGPFALPLISRLRCLPGRINRDWRFYFTIEGGTYVIQKLIAHPK